MRLVERHIIKKAHPFYQECKDLCFNSKNLYNKALYLIRQEYINNKNYWNYYAVEKYLKQNEIPEYRYLPVKSSQQTLMLLHKNWLSFFGLLKLVKTKEYQPNKVNLPKYRNKDGLYPVTFTYMGFSKKYLKQGLIKLEKTNIILAKTLMPFWKKKAENFHLDLITLYSIIIKLYMNLLIGCAK